MAVAANVYAIVMPLVSGQPEAPEEQAEAPTDEASTDPEAALFSW